MGSLNSIGMESSKFTDLVYFGYDHYGEEADNAQKDEKEFIETLSERFPSVTAISFIAEGFETLDKNRLGGRDLRSAFIEEDDLVRECITVTHCEKLPQTANLEITLLSLPYEYKLGRTVEWGRPLGFVSGMDKVLKTSSVSQMLRSALSQPSGDYYSDDDIDILFNKIISSGFNIEGF